MRGRARDGEDGADVVQTDRRRENEVRCADWGNVPATVLGFKCSCRAASKEMNKCVAGNELI